MNNNLNVVTGVYEHLDTTVEAINELRGKGHDDLTVYSPVPNEELDEALGEPESKVGYISFSGGVLGWMAGLALTVGTALLLPLITGGKPIVSFIPFYVIGFEMAILFGGGSTILAFVLFALIPKRNRKGPFNPRFVEDRFGITVRCSESSLNEVENILRSKGAEDVNRDKI